MKTIDLAVEQICGSKVVSITRFSAGDISGASKVELADGRIVVAKEGDPIGSEARMLRALGEAGAPVPKVHGVRGGTAILEYLGAGEPLSDAVWDALPDALSPLRQVEGQRFGWNEDYAFRHVAVLNAWCHNWSDFWRDNRLLCHVPHLSASLARRTEALAAELPNLIPANPPVALVHGDLWGGNIVVRRSKPWLIDPCAYYGDREVDVASLTVFNNPPDALFDALDLDVGWRARLPVYRLWMWLLHIRLFGDSYNSAAEREFERLGF